jgi:hypothetical protein
MPYVARKQGDKYVVYKKKADGSAGERVGATDGTKEALHKYLAALHINAKESKQEFLKRVIREEVAEVVKDFVNKNK